MCLGQIQAGHCPMANYDLWQRKLLARAVACPMPQDQGTKNNLVNQDCATINVFVYF